MSPSRRLGRRVARLALLAPLPFIGSGPALADWTIRPRIEVDETYTDNVFDNDFIKRSDWITTIAPGLNIRDDGAKARVNFDYQPTARIYAQESSQTNVEQRFSGTALVNPLDGFFVDARAYGSQRSITGDRRLTNDNAPLSNNDRTQIYSYSISPFFRARLSGTANIEARYRFTQTISADSTFNSSLGSTIGNFGSIDSRQQTLSLIGTSGSELGRLEARGYAYAAQIAGQGVLNNAERDRIGTEGEYHVSHSVGLIAGVGYEKVRYAQFTGFGTSVNVKGATWLAGIHLTPTEDSSARITYGRRDGINGLNADVTWQLLPRTRVFATWSEGLTTSAEQIGQNVASFQRDDLTGDPLDAASRPLFAIDDNNFALQNAVYRARGGRIGASWTGDRMSATLSAYIERRTVAATTGAPFGNANNQNSKGVSFLATRQLSELESGNFNIGYRVGTGTDSFSLSGNTERDWNVGVGYSRILGEGFSAVAQYSYYNRSGGFSSGFFGRNSSTNTITVGLRKQF
ncbi:MAG: hypothetical protein JWM77_3393 [Rhodospirillales bacterium]|nr:hypothetical protein [Rhodospirillales bacterium]